MGSSSVKFERVVQEGAESLVFGTSIPARAGWVATVDLEDGGRLIIDRLDGDTRWLVNGEWAPGKSFPKFWNGQLSRCTFPVLPSDEMTEFVEREFNAFIALIADGRRAVAR